MKFILFWVIILFAIKFIELAKISRPGKNSQVKSFDANTHQNTAHPKVFDTKTIEDLRLLLNGGNLDTNENNDLRDFEINENENIFIRKVNGSWNQIPIRDNDQQSIPESKTPRGAQKSKAKSPKSKEIEEKHQYVIENGWLQFKFDKSFILVDRTVTREEADRICDEFNKVEDTGAEVAVPQSAEEQEFINDYVFRLSHSLKNVWIGQMTDNYRNDTAGRPLYSNWGKGMPTMTKPCVQIRSPYTIYGDLNETVGGKWEDVSCDRTNVVLCQRPQHWSENQFIRVVTDLKKEVDKLKKHMAMDQIPQGFIYTQLPDQPSPIILWPMFRWEDISKQYAGLFFRVVGSGSAAFGRLQEGSAPRLNGVQTYPYHGVSNEDLRPTELFADNLWSSDKWEANGLPVSFRISADEVRPKNTAIKVWRRG